MIDSLSYHEAMELAYFGAKVIHPQTMAPGGGEAASRSGSATRSRRRSPARSSARRPTSTHAVKGITSIDAVALVNVEGAGMIGVPGTAQRLFGALREDGISVILISQGSSEHSICFAVPEDDAERTERTVRRAFAAELRDGQIQNVDVLTRAAASCRVVGDGMAGTPGVAAKRLRRPGGGRRQRARHRAGLVGAQHLGGHRRASRPRAPCAPCTPRFYLSPHTVSIGVVGPGVVGRTLLEQMWSQVPRLLARLQPRPARARR